MVQGDRSSPYSRRTHLLARIARRAFRWRFLLLHARRYNTMDLARVRGLSLLVLPGVFHPEFFFATAFFLRYLGRRAITPGMRTLDMGTGSGALAVALALRGTTATAVDINQEAVRCARINARWHGLEGRLCVHQGDLFAPVAGEQFDLITFNPPFYDRQARDMADRAWASGSGNETLRRFLHEAPRHLRPGGELLVAGSTEAPYSVDLARASGYSVRLVARRELIGEQLFLFALRPEDLA